MNKRQVRMAVIAGAGVLLVGATALILNGLQSSVVYFYGPTEFARAAPGADRNIRLGGLVEAGSIVRTATGALNFVVTDNVSRIPVSYPNNPPDLFREGQGVVAEGSLGTDGVFHAKTLLAKHDETYMPREVAEALKEAGEWRPETGEAPKPGF
jgi:cytochrome c-type biogenesis protein CcmE